MEGSANISPCEIYRYTLVRIWDADLPRALFVLLNPSTADAAIDDNTLRRGIAFAKLWGYGSVEFVNLFAFRSTDPTVLKAASVVNDVVGPHNNEHIAEAAKRADVIVLAWGANGSLLDRNKVVLYLLKDYELSCLGKTTHGHPKHPLRLAATTPLQPWVTPEKLPCNCGVSKGLRSDHEGECQAAYLPKTKTRTAEPEKMTLMEKAAVLNAVEKALTDPGTDTVARRIVMRKAVFNLTEEIARNLKEQGIERTPAEVLSVAIECGLPFAPTLIAKMHAETLAQGTVVAEATRAQAETELAKQGKVLCVDCRKVFKPGEVIVDKVKKELPRSDGLTRCGQCHRQKYFGNYKIPDRPCWEFAYCSDYQGGCGLPTWSCECYDDDALYAALTHSVSAEERWAQRRKGLVDQGIELAVKVELPAEVVETEYWAAKGGKSPRVALGPKTTVATRPKNLSNERARVLKGKKLYAAAKRVMMDRENRRPVYKHPGHYQPFRDLLNLELSPDGPAATQALYTAYDGHPAAGDNLKWEWEDVWLGSLKGVAFDRVVGVPMKAAVHRVQPASGSVAPHHGKPGFGPSLPDAAFEF